MEKTEKIGKVIDSMDMKPQAILLTHGHFDHVLAAPALREACLRCPSS